MFHYVITWNTINYLLHFTNFLNILIVVSLQLYQMRSLSKSSSTLLGDATTTPQYRRDSPKSEFSDYNQRNGIEKFHNYNLGWF